MTLGRFGLVGLLRCPSLDAELRKARLSSESSRERVVDLDVEGMNVGPAI